MTKAFRRPWQSIRQGDTRMLTFICSRETRAFETFFIFTNVSWKNLPSRWTWQCNLLTSAIGCKFLTCKQKSLSWSGSHGGFLDRNDREQWSRDHLDMSKSWPNCPKVIATSLHKENDGLLKYLCCFSTLVAFSCPNFYLDLLTQNSDNRVSCHWLAFEYISRQLFMILATVVRGL